MKKKFLSGFLALAMVLAVFVPVMAEDSKTSPTRDKEATVEKQEATVGDKTIAIVSDGTSVSGTDAVITFKQSSMSDTDAEAKASEKFSGSYSYVTVFELEANEVAAKLIEGNAISVNVKVDGAEKGDTYYALHVKSNGDTEKLDCTVSATGVVTIKGITSCSPFILVKETTGSNNKNNSTPKHLTCEEEKGEAWTWSEAKKACVYRVTNTATK